MSKYGRRREALRERERPQEAWRDETLEMLFEARDKPDEFLSKRLRRT